MRHQCHDPFCMKRMAKNNHRKYIRRGPPKKRKSPQCTAAVQMDDHTVGGLHPWRRCQMAVGPGGDTATMRCRFHKKGAVGEGLPTWRQTNPMELVSIQP